MWPLPERRTAVTAHPEAPACRATRPRPGPRDAPDLVDGRVSSCVAHREYRANAKRGVAKRPRSGPRDSPDLADSERACTESDSHARPREQPALLSRNVKFRALKSVRGPEASNTIRENIMTCSKYSGSCAKSEKLSISQDTGVLGPKRIQDRSVSEFHVPSARWLPTPVCILPRTHADLGKHEERV